MADQLGVNNTQQRLISGNGASKKSSRPININKNEDSLVVNASEKRYLWTARAFAVIVSISLCCNLILIMTLANILPLYRIEPYLVTISGKEDQVYHIEPLPSLMKRKDITETFVREYILLRYTYLSDIEEMKSRWEVGGDVQEMSLKSVYDKFKPKIGPLLKRIEETGLKSTVKINTVNEIDNNIWTVGFRVDYTTPSEPKPKIKYYKAQVKITYQRKKVKFNERLKNPIGFKVYTYSVAEDNERN